MEMGTNTITLSLSGEVTLQDLQKAMDGLRQLVYALSSEIAANMPIEWYVEELSAGSALATFRGDSPDEEVLDSIVQAYGLVGTSLEKAEPIPYSSRVKKGAHEITRLVDGRISAIRFETAVTQATITAAARKGLPSPGLEFSQGLVKGLVQTLTSRGSLRFTLYDSIFDRAVSCYLNQGQEEIMRGSWGNFVHVSGRVGREPERGRPVVVRDITDVRVITVIEPGAYRRARAALRERATDEPAEETLRQLRDDE
jgi:hypothetical protein